MRWPWQRKDPDVPAHLATGLWGEQVAERSLAAKGWRIVGRRIRFGPREELDLVAYDGATLVFVEVKTRANEDFGRAASAVNPAKRQAISRAAWSYLRRMRPPPQHHRIDVIEVIGRREGPPPVVRHIEHAFPLQGGLRLPW